MAYDVVVRNARAVGTDSLMDIGVRDGRIAYIGDRLADYKGSEIDAAGGLVTPSFVDAHFHPDKALTFPRVGKSDDLSLEATLRRGAEIKRDFSSADVEERALASFKVAVSQGIGAMRAHVDVDADIGLLALDAVLNAKRQMHEYLDIQIVAFAQQGLVHNPAGFELLEQALLRGADAVGGGPENEPARSDWRPHVTRLVEFAREHDVTVDIHVDMAEDDSLRNMALTAEVAIAEGMRGRVNVIHCCALSSYSDVDAAQTIALVREAQLNVCICPIGNLLITGNMPNPRGRGASRAKELVAASVNVAVGSDNLFDMWFRFGNLDPIELIMITCLATGMGSDAEVEKAYRMGTSGGAAFMGLTDRGMHRGAVADLVVFGATSLSEVLRRGPETRLVLKRGQVVAGRKVELWNEELPRLAHLG